MGQIQINGGRRWAEDRFVPNTFLKYELPDEPTDICLQLGEEDLILPGLLDMHTHLWAPPAVSSFGVAEEKYYATGFVGALDAGTYGVDGWKAADRFWRNAGHMHIKSFLSVLPEGLTIFPPKTPTTPEGIDVDRYVQMIRGDKERALGVKVQLGWLPYKSVTTDTQLLAAVLATVMLLGVTACGNKPSADGDNAGTTGTTVLKMGHVYSETYPMHLAMLAMAHEVYEKTEGRYKIDIHPNSALGNESDLNEGVNIGTVDMAFTATTPLANIVPDLACLDLPYLIRDSAHADAVFFDESSPIRASLINSIDSAGFKALALVENGFRQLYTNKKVASTADLKGLKIRVMENPLHLELWNALGASPTAMAASEAMTGLQQGTIDAVEMFHTAYATSGFAELCKYYVNTNHIYTCGVLLLSAKVWNGMSEADQKVFADAAATMAATTNSQLRDMDESSREKIVNELVEGAFDLDKTELRAMVQPVYDAHPEYSDFVAQVDALAK